MKQRIIKSLVLGLLIISPLAAKAAYAASASPTTNPAPPTASKGIVAPKTSSKAPVVIPGKPLNLSTAKTTKTLSITPIQANVSSTTKLAAPQSMTLSDDNTQPVGPTQVTATANGLSSIKASWDAANDPESGIDYYVFGVGTNAKGNYSTLANVRYWQAVYGTSTTISLSMDTSVTYYVSVYSVNGAGLSGPIVTSAAIHPSWPTLGQDTNQLSLAFAPTGFDASGNQIAGFTADQQATITAFYNNMYPILRQIYGPPAVNYTVTAVRDLRYTNSNEFMPDTDEIHMSDSFYPQLFTHEITHAFREKYILSSDANWKYDPTLSGFEEGFAQAVSYEVMNKYVLAYPNDPVVAGNTLWGSSMDWDYDYQNVPELRGTNFWSDSGGTLLYWTRYEVAAAAIRKLNIESPNFYANFNQKYYSLINANPSTTRPSQSLIVGIIAGITPQVEGVPTATWISQQNIFYDQNVYGDKIYHQIQDYPTSDYYVFQKNYLLNTMSCGSEWACYDGTKWVYYNMNGSTGTANLTDVNGNTVWSGNLQIQPTTNPSDGNYTIGNAELDMTTASTLDPWPGGDPSTYIMNLTNFGLYKFNTTFIDRNTGANVTNSVYRVFGSQITNFKGVWGGVIGHKNGTIYLNHDGYAAEAGIPVTNGAFAGTRSWTGVYDARTNGYDSVPGKVSVTFVDSDTGATYTAQRDIDYGSQYGNQMFLFDFSASSQPTSSVSVTVPAANATVYGSTTLTAVPSAGTTLSSVSFKIDGTTVGSPDTTAPYSYAWNSASVADGQHTVTAVATTTQGTVLTSSPVTVNVANNAPAVSVSSPANNASVGGTVAVTANVVSNSGTSKVMFYNDNAKLIGTATASPYSVNWDTSSLTVGSSHTLYAVAYALNGKTTTSAKITVTIKDSTPPTVKITAPTNGSQVTRSSNVTISATASDNKAVTKVEFYVNNVLVCTDTKSSYSCGWNVPSGANISYTLVAKAYDAAGNTTSDTVTVTSK